MLPNITVFLLMLALGSVAAQTFQYSRGWTNGKRDGRKSDVAGNVEKILSPCQLNKLKYVLEGKPLNERLLIPCDYMEEDETQPKRYKNERNQDPLYEIFQ
ncbi:pro-corazonin-like [Plodia interpunctella]|uniref:pro-corazonin-like n=1 Tax=Plodia interpunctella TaxID=58824 RepID=UPI0023689DA1|nr:pro-corazonin-like [Plodia interpunctella]XP_053619826.1 pro-corazonin-like [Plodia interpunctella]